MSRRSGLELDMSTGGSIGVAAMSDEVKRWSSVTLPARTTDPGTDDSWKGWGSF